MRTNTPIPRIHRSGSQREALREKGQFWTPDWVAEAMVAYVAGGGSDHIFDPAVGAGAFLKAAKVVACETERNITLLGAEIDPEALQKARLNGLTEDDLAHVKITDFVLHPPPGPYKAIVANPPYIRHHRLSSRVKTALKAFSTCLIGTAIDGRAGLHIYFMLRALQLLDSNGRLAFIVPADTCEGIFAPTLWDWIAKKYRLEAVVTFSPGASPFPKVDTNPIILMIRNAKPETTFYWVKCTVAGTEHLKAWVLSGFDEAPGSVLQIHQRRLSEGLATGLSRAPTKGQPASPILADWVRVLRGIATGANEFFFMTARRAASLGIPEEFFVPAIGRTRDVPGDVITAETLNVLEARNRPTLLFSPDGRPIDDFPRSVREYLKQGEAKGLNERALLSTRRPWYKMETRPSPPFLFAYLGRRNARFLRNSAGVVPLTGFLCVYPHRKDRAFLDNLWEVLRHPETTENLSLVGKSYGSGAIKVEPRALERLPLSASFVAEVGLQLPEVVKQLEFCYP